MVWKDEGGCVAKAMYPGSLLPPQYERDSEAAELADIEEDESGKSEAEHEGTADEHYTDSALTMYLRDVQRNALLSADEEKDIAARVADGDQVARTIMILSNLRLVVKMAKRYLNRGMPFLDLIEEGNVGLIKAVDRFRLEKECRFSTYATWWIRQNIERSLDNQSRTVRLPVQVCELVGKIGRATKTLGQELDREPTSQELADRLGVDLPRIRDLLTLSKRTYSMDHPLGSAGDFFLSDVIEDTGSLTPVELLENQGAYERVSEGFKTLTDTEKRVLTLRFGLEDRPPETLESIGCCLNVTRERIRQIESKALQKLRSLLELNE
jgi:RNA polymerase primary sigma factor